MKREDGWPRCNGDQSREDETKSRMKGGCSSYIVVVLAVSCDIPVYFARHIRDL
jgi:hypothetical protein